jgi:pantothenate kinase
VDLTYTYPQISELVTNIGQYCGQRLIIGLAGPPASGKSTLATVIADEINRQRRRSAIVLPMDGFHLSNSQLEHMRLNSVKGAPQTFDVKGFIVALSRIRSPAQDTIFVPVYDRVIHEPIAASIAISEQTHVVVVEGNYLLLDSGDWKDVRQYLDRACFLNVGWEVCRDRLIARQMAKGRSLAEASQWVDRSDKANYELIVSRSNIQGVCLIS